MIMTIIPQGIKPYSEQDSEILFGVHDKIKKIVSAIQKSRFQFLFGPSGSGKTSILRAGQKSIIKELNDNYIIHYLEVNVFESFESENSERPEH